MRRTGNKPSNGGISILWPITGVLIAAGIGIAVVAINSGDDGETPVAAPTTQTPDRAVGTTVPDDGNDQHTTPVDNALVDSELDDDGPGDTELDANEPTGTLPNVRAESTAPIDDDQSVGAAPRTVVEVPAEVSAVVNAAGGDDTLANDLYSTARPYTGGWDGAILDAPAIDTISVGVFMGPRLTDDTLTPWWVAVLLVLDDGFAAPDQAGVGTQLGLAIAEQTLVPVAGPDGFGDPGYSRYVFADPQLRSFGAGFAETRTGVAAVSGRAALLAHPIPAPCLTSVCSWDVSNFYRQPDDDGPDEADPTAFQVLKLAMYDGRFVSPDELTDQLIADGDPLTVPNDYRRVFTPFQADELAHLFVDDGAPLPYDGLSTGGGDDDATSPAVIDLDEDTYDIPGFGSTMAEIDDGPS